MQIHRTRSSISFPTESGGRSKGFHVSGLIRSAAIRAGILKIDANRQRDDEDPDFFAPGTTFSSGARLLMSLGLAWEEYLSQFLDRVLFHPGEYSLDGVSGQPDGLEFNDDNTFTLHEIKLTFKSMSAPPERHWMWIAQCLAYIKMVQAASGLACRGFMIHVLWLQGDYKTERSPVLETLVFVPTQDEIDNNWRVLLAEKDGTPIIGEF